MESSAAGMIDLEICEQVLCNDLRVIAAVDGSEKSMVAMAYVTDGLMQAERSAFVNVLHTYSDSKAYLPVSCQKDALRSTCENKLVGSVSSKRCKLTWVEKTKDAGSHICDAICELGAQYVCMGFYGLKGKKEEAYHDIMGAKLSSNVATVLNQGNSCSLLCIKDDSADVLPIRERSATFVVSASLSKSSTKACLDALRLSKPGDQVHVVYISSYTDSGDADLSPSVQAKFEGLFNALSSSGRPEVSSRFTDREVKFVVDPKQRGETTPEAINRYAEAVSADFLVVGANAADRVARGKKPVGSVSLQMCILASRNFIVSNWIDVSPKVYEEMIRGARPPL
jgi:nucleotide-binding universal stress UspA family protein